MSSESLQYQYRKLKMMAGVDTSDITVSGVTYLKNRARQQEEQCDSMLYMTMVMVTQQEHCM